MANLIGRVQAAKILAVTPQALDKALKSGRISYADAEKRLFDEAGLRAQWEANRRRRRIPASASAPDLAPADGDETLPALQRRRLQAEIHLLEAKAGTAGAHRFSTRGLERALFRFWTAGRACEDTLHPKLLERLAVADLLPEARDPRYGAVYSDVFRMGREAWVNIWMALYGELRREFPAWADAWFAEFARRERGHPSGDGDGNSPKGGNGEDKPE